MCGIAVLSGAVPQHVRAMAVAGAAARGPHTHGWGHRNGDGWTVHRYPGRLTYATCPAMTAIYVKDIYIGHSRLATSGSRSGDTPPVLESQPYVSSGQYLVAHNGTLPDVEAGTVDTMRLLALLEAGMDLERELAGAERPQAVVWAVEGHVAALRVDGRTTAAHPLYAARGAGWVAVSSGPLPKGRLIPAGKRFAIRDS